MFRPLHWVKGCGSHSDEALIRPLQGCSNPPTYKEALVKPPPVNMSQQLETDDCLCERCGHIMARVFAMAANKTDQAKQQIQNQFETHNRRFEQNRIPRSRFAQNPNGPQGPYRREPSEPQGPYRREPNRPQEPYRKEPNGPQGPYRLEQYYSRN
jgi:hypothetical protein